MNYSGAVAVASLFSRWCLCVLVTLLSNGSCRKENVHRHVLRLLLHLHHKVAPAKLESLQKALEPTKQVGREAGEREN